MSCPQKKRAKQIHEAPSHCCLVDVITISNVHWAGCAFWVVMGESRPVHLYLWESRICWYIHITRCEGTKTVPVTPPLNVLGGQVHPNAKLRNIWGLFLSTHWLDGLADSLVRGVRQSQRSFRDRNKSVTHSNWLGMTRGSRLPFGPECVTHSLYPVGDYDCCWMNGWRWW